MILALYLSLLYSQTSAAGVVWAFYDEKMAEYRRVAEPQVESGQWRRLSPGMTPPQDAWIFAFGTRAAQSLPAGSSRVVEVFVGGRTPYVQGHEILPWEPPAQAVADLAVFLRHAHPERPVCILAGPRTREWAQEAASAMQNAQALDFRDLAEALSFVSRLHAKPSSCAAVVLTADFEVLDFPVFHALAQLQIRAGIPLAARTRHEVLLGAAAAVEPYRKEWRFPPASPNDARIFRNGAVWRFLGLPDAALPARWEPMTLGN